MAEKAAVGWGVVAGKRRHPTFSVTIETVFFRLLLVGNVMEGEVRGIVWQRGGAFLWSEPEKKQDGQANQEKAGVEQPRRQFLLGCMH